MLKIFSIHDSKAAAYNSPFYQKTAGQAERSVRNSLRSADSDLAKNPADYSLVQLGEFNPDTGEIIPTLPIIIANLQTLATLEQ